MISEAAINPEITVEMYDELLEQNQRLVEEIRGLKKKIERMTGQTNSSPSRVLGIMAAEKGAIAEVRALGALNELISMGRNGLISARRATPEEDSAGIDLVVETDRGTLTIQCKSSKAGRDAAFAKRSIDQKFPIIVVVKQSNSKEEVLQKMESAVGEGRALLKKEARKANKNQEKE